jgi:hypothetical protein
MDFLEPHKTAIIAYSNDAAAHNQEHCGVIVLDGADIKYLPMRNVAIDPCNNFEFDAQEWETIADRTLAIVHSHHAECHPGELTPCDIENARVFGKAIVVYHAKFGAWDYWDPLDWYPWPLRMKPNHPAMVEDFIGWPFIYGRADCWALVRGWYLGRLGIALKDYPRGNIAQLEAEVFDPFMESFERFGFEDVADDDIQDNDVLILRMGRNGATHCAVVTDAANGIALHHVGEGLLSSTFSIDRWKTRLHAVMRYVECK